MAAIKVSPLRDDLPFGARVTGVTYDAIADTATRQQLNLVFEDRGLIVFEGLEPTSKMQVAISSVFGPLKDHPVKNQRFVDEDMLPGVVEMLHTRDHCALVEIEGRELMSWLPWHFDHCYNNELNRAGVLRAIDIPPEGGKTGFADCIALYRDVDPALRRRIEDLNIIYTLDTCYENLRFGIPKNWRLIHRHPGDQAVLDEAKTMPRAVHPAVWTRASGEKVLHVSPWMAKGIEGHEDAEGEALFEAVCQEVVAKVRPYFHQWQAGDMVIWDNWRVLHSSGGCDPQYVRRMHRTTIKGDYGLGYFEGKSQGRYALLEKTV